MYYLTRVPSLSARPPPSLFLNNGLPRLFRLRIILDALFWASSLFKELQLDSLSEHSSFSSCDLAASFAFSASDKLLSDPLLASDPVGMDCNN